MGFQLRDSFNPKVNEELMPPKNAPATQKPVLIQKDKSVCPELVTLNEGCGNPVVTEINGGYLNSIHTQFPLQAINAQL